MNILFEILNEQHYMMKDTISFEFSRDSKSVNYEVTPFISLDYPMQAVLVVCVNNSELSNVSNNEFLKKLAVAFRKQNFHQSDMDKNTTLIIKSLRDDQESVNLSAKVQIEDNPYYFKKYVFSYSKVEEKHAIDFVIEKKKSDNGSELVSNIIQKYLFSTDMFTKYKNNADDAATYKYFSELSIKIPFLPLEVTTSSEILTVDQILCKNKKYDEAKIKKINAFLDLNFDFKEDDVESIIFAWENN